MPKLADTLVEGTVARWLKQLGDHVLKGEPFVEIETEKVNSELEAPVDGVLIEVLVQPGETVDVGTVIARIREAAEANPNTGPINASTLRRDGGVQGLSLMRRRIAERMQEARATIAQGACVREARLPIDPTNQQISLTALFVKAVAVAAGVQQIGIAVEVTDGLLVPVVRGVQALTLKQTSERVRDLAARARDRRLLPEEVVGAQFTVTNVGALGTLMAFPLVPPGQPGILASGSIRDGACFLTLCYDRKAMNDYQADRLLRSISDALGKL